MQPTSKLRFVKRRVPVSSGSFNCRVQYQDVRVLQQWWAPVVNIGWADIQTGAGEWRDVELVEDAEQT